MYCNILVSVMKRRIVRRFFGVVQWNMWCFWSWVVICCFTLCLGFVLVVGLGGYLLCCYVCFEQRLDHACIVAS